MALQELLYTSLAIPTASHENVADILKVSQTNNAEHNLTGLLLFDGYRYIQILEGTAENLSVLYAAIEEDPRHYDLELIYRGGIEARAFQDWRMAFESLPPGLLNDLAENMSVFALDVEAETMLEGESFGARLNGMFMDAIAAE